MATRARRSASEPESDLRKVASESLKLALFPLELPVCPREVTPGRMLHGDLYIPLPHPPPLPIRGRGPGESLEVGSKPIFEGGLGGEYAVERR